MNALDLEEVSEGVYQRVCDNTWWGVAELIGGYVQALVLRAIERTLNDAGKSPLTLHIQFLRPVVPGVVRIGVDAKRRGRRLSNATCTVESGGKLAAVASAAFAKPQAAAGFLEPEPPAFEPPHATEVPSDPHSGVAAHSHYDLYPRVGSFARGAGCANVGGWVVPRWPTPLSTSLLAMVADLWLPAAYHRWRDEVNVVGIDNTIHFRRATLPPAASNALQIRLASKASQDGYVDEDGEIWSSTGELLCQYRWMRLIL